MDNTLNNKKNLLPFHSIYWKREKTHTDKIFIQYSIFHKSVDRYRKHFYKINLKDY